MGFAHGTSFLSLLLLALKFFYSSTSSFFPNAHPRVRVARLREPLRHVSIFFWHNSRLQFYLNERSRSAAARMGKSTLSFEHRNGESELWLLV